MLLQTLGFDMNTPRYLDKLDALLERLGLKSGGANAIASGGSGSSGGGKRGENALFAKHAKTTLTDLLHTPDVLRHAPLSLAWTAVHIASSVTKRPLPTRRDVADPRKQPLPPPKHAEEIWTLCAALSEVYEASAAGIAGRATAGSTALAVVPT